MNSVNIAFYKIFDQKFDGLYDESLPWGRWHAKHDGWGELKVG